MIKMIVAYDNNYAIGKDNDLLFFVKEDLKRFKQLTSNSTVVMGRKTYESLPEKNRPLPNRHNIILTRGIYPVSDINVSVLNSIDKVLEYAKMNDIWVIGGAGIYEQMLPYTNEIYATHILDSKPADSYFPRDYLLSHFIADSIETKHEGSLKYQFVTYIKNKKLK